MVSGSIPAMAKGVKRVKCRKRYHRRIPSKSHQNPIFRRVFSLQWFGQWFAPGPGKGPRVGRPRTFSDTFWEVWKFRLFPGAVEPWCRVVQVHFILVKATEKLKRLKLGETSLNLLFGNTFFFLCFVDCTKESLAIVGLLRSTHNNQVVSEVGCRVSGIGHEISERGLSNERSVRLDLHGDQEWMGQDPGTLGVHPKIAAIRRCVSPT